jgi:hypothetical protein
MRTVEVTTFIDIFEEGDNFNTNGTHKIGELNGVFYSDLVDILGEPTFDEPSGDDKVQKEWVIEFKGDIFTIYDWKTFNEEYTTNELDRWSIGGKGSNPDELIAALQTKYDSL